MPQARLIINWEGKGSVASRHRMMLEAQGDLVLALDDDSYPEQTDCLARLEPLFEANPRLAVATFPQRTDEYPATLNQTDFGPPKLVASFANSGACLRTSVYRQLPGFEPMFFHMYEEPDYALQCVCAGYEVLRTPIVTIRHHYTPKSRSEVKNHGLHARNEFWSVFLRCPFPMAFGIAAYKVVSQFRYACKKGPAWIVREPLWWGKALFGLPAVVRQRKPVSWAGYRRWLRLSSNPVVVHQSFSPAGGAGKWVCQ